MSEQQIDRDELRRRAAGRHTIFMRPEHLLPLLDQLDQAEARIQAVKDVLAAWHVEPGESGLADDLLRALDGEA